MLCCFALFVCLTLHASFFLPSHLSFKNMYMYIYYIYTQCIYAPTGRVSCADVSVCVEGRSAGEGELCSGEGRPAGDPQVRLAVAGQTL